MKSNNQQCKKPLISKREQNYIIDDELTEESTIFEQTTQSFSEISELDSKQQFEIKHCEYNKSEQVFKQKQKDNQIPKVEVFYEDLTQYIQQFKPKHIELDVKLKPFIPDYIPAVNQMEDGLSIQRPDGKFDNYGLHDVRELFLGQQVDKDQTMLEDTQKQAIKKETQNTQKQKEKNQQKPQAKENLQGNPTDIFKIISLYAPKQINIEAHLKPFIPEYIPQVLDPDPMLKIPRPDGKKDDLGLTVLVNKFFSVRMKGW